MLNRRYLRTLVMRALYGFFQSDSNDLAKGERELFTTIDKIYDLYIYQLALFDELRHVAAGILEDAKTKHLPTKENLNPNMKFVENKFIAKLSENIHLKREINNRKISWNNEHELVKKLFLTIKSSELYWKYMNVSDDSYEVHQRFIINIFKENIADFELLNQLYEERSLNWGDDIYLVNPTIVKTLETFGEFAEPDMPLITLYKEKEEDIDFVSNLFVQTILKNQEVETLIAERTRNWEVDRIAMMDVLLMKMAITEMLQFENIPLSVSFNEYLEISKTYSTPKSSAFINGILDKLVIDLKAKDMFHKSGRGLME